MCPECAELGETIPIRTPGQYFELLKHIRAMLANNTLMLVCSNVDLNEIAPGKPSPADIIDHVFGCAACGQRFHFVVETYHGSGGSWAPVDESGL